MNIDTGILPAGSVVIKNELSIADGPYGALGSMVYIGQLIGSLAATYVLNKGDTKMILSISLSLNIVSLILFTLVSYYPVLLVCRILTGLFQIFFSIFLPVWADTFGNEKQKSIWISYFIISNSLGIILGYIISALV